MQVLRKPSRLALSCLVVAGLTFTLGQEVAMAVQIDATFAKNAGTPTPGASSLESKIEVTPCEINVTSPAYNQFCYINHACPIVWDTTNLKSYGSVFLHVVQVDAQHIQGWEGGGFPVANTGSYQWVVPENVGPLTGTGTAYQIKVITPDQKCSGKSRLFGIEKKTMQMPVQTPRVLKK